MTSGPSPKRPTGRLTRDTRRKTAARPRTARSKDEPKMSIREELARVIARDPRYTIEGYAFVLESLTLARNRKLKAMSKRERARQSRSRKKAAAEAKPEVAGHVTGRELCLSARRLAVRLFGSMAVIVLDQWGI